MTLFIIRTFFLLQLMPSFSLLFSREMSEKISENVLPSFYSIFPFLLVLLSIAFFPIILKKLSHKFENYILIFCVILGIFILYLSTNFIFTSKVLTAVLIKEYLPFIILISTLYVISSGIKINIRTNYSPLKGASFLFFCGILTNLIGTTGASILFFKPFLEINKYRKKKIHSVLFFIFIVSNVGGALTPLGDPPLFLGFLKGVDFFWNIKNCSEIYFFVMTSLIFLYYLIDSIFYYSEKKFLMKYHSDLKNKIEIFGIRNIFLLFLITVSVSFSSFIPKINFFSFNGVNLYLNSFLRDLSLLIIAFYSFMRPTKIFDKKIIELNNFSFKPISEVMRFFLAIFITMAPVTILLKNGISPFDGIKDFINASSNKPFLYFWLVSPFSSFLDNAPTYLVFFKMAGGNAIQLMTKSPNILKAISMSSVFMGAMTYIGNAPNFMIKSLAEEAKIKMPNFFIYILISSTILLPIFLITSYIFLR